MKLSVAFLAVALGGCAFGSDVSKMTPEQLRATAGIVTCTEAETTYPGAVVRGSTITANVDETRKGAVSKNDVSITCGKATMTLKNEVGVGTPAPQAPAPAVQ